MNLDALFDVSMKKERKLLDLSKVKIEDYTDYLKYMDKVPELKMAPEQPDVSSILCSLRDFSFAPSRLERLELDASRISPQLEDPMPLSMRAVRMDDLQSVDIHWKMLTDLRPLNRKEEDYFNKLIDLGKLERESRRQEAKQLALQLTNIPSSSVQAKALSLGFIISKSKRGTVETRIKCCKECGLELCTGAWCKVGQYECYARAILDKDELDEEEGFSLKAVIAQATSQPDRKAEEKKIRDRRKAKATQRKGRPSLGVMIKKVKPKKRRKKKRKVKEDVESDSDSQEVN